MYHRIPVGRTSPSVLVHRFERRSRHTHVQRIRQFSRGPMFPVLVFGLLNVANWLNGMRNHGCTGHELTWLRWIGIAVCCGVASQEAPWVSAIVMCLPAWVTSFRFASSCRLEEYGSAYVVHLILVHFGYALRHAVFLPISKGLWGEGHDMPGAASTAGNA